MPAPTTGSTSEAVLAHVAQLFYERDMTKQDIATQLGISRFKVARMLDQAKADGIVRIEIRSRGRVNADLSRRLEAGFGLETALVVDDDPETELLDSLASVAATFLTQILRKDDVLGVAWGSTLQRVADRVETDEPLGIPVVQICGAFAQTDHGSGPMELTWEFASKIGGRPHWLPAPAVVEDKPALQQMLSHPAVAATAALFNDVTVALLAIGALTGSGRSALVDSGAILPREQDVLHERGAVGDLLLHVFDRAGSFVESPLASRAVAMSIEQLRNTRKVIAVAGGEGKHEAIAGALRTGVVDLLVTDVASALYALDTVDVRP